MCWGRRHSEHPTAGQVAPQAQLEESANDLGSAGSGRRQKTDGFPYRNQCKSPFLNDFFLESEPYVHRPARKVAAEKKRTDRHTQTKSGRSRARPGPCFGQLNARYQSQNLSKVVPKTSGGFLLRSQLMSTSGSVGRWHSPQVAPAAQKTRIIYECVTFFGRVV